MNKHLILLGLISVLANADNGNPQDPPVGGPPVRIPPVERPPVIQPPRNIPDRRPVLRQIPMKPEFKNIRFRGYARETNYDAKNYLTHPLISRTYDLDSLSPNSLAMFKQTSADIVKNLDNFNVNLWENFVRGLATDSANADIEALVYLVLMEAAKEASADLKGIMESLKDTQEAKEALRNKQEHNEEFLADCRKRGCSRESLANIRTAVDKIKQSMDSMSEMGEMESLRLQMVMDRMSKMMSTLSNLLKKMSDTAQSITQNLK